MAGRIPEAAVDDVLARASIVDIVGEHVRLKRQGSRMVGLCPFHQEKTPSFSVSPDRNLYYCFGCGASGNTVGFLMKHAGMSFPEAIRMLADRYGVTIPEQDEDPVQAQRRKKSREAYFEATELATRYYEHQLWKGDDEAPRTYLRERGIDDETARRFRLGFAPEGWSSLVDAAGTRGMPSAALEHAGLALPRKQGEGYYDRFRNRVMFPICDVTGKVLAFSGRTLDPEERAKYVNSPETDFYRKGRELFGIHLAHRAIRKDGAAVLVEGNFDVVSLHARGLQNVVAPLGTALTDRQAHLLKRYTERMVICFDGDSAGRAAAHKALKVLLESEANDIAWAELPDGADPDDLVQSEGADALRARFENAPSMLDRVLDDAIAPAVGAAGPSEKQAALDTAAEWLAHVKSDVVRSTWSREAARRLGLDEAIIGRHLRRAAAGDRRPGPPPPDDAPPMFEDRPRLRPLTPSEAMLVFLLAEQPELLGDFHREQAHFLVRHPQLQAFLETTAALWVEGGGPHLQSAVEALDDPALRELLTATLVQGEVIATEEYRRVFSDTLRAMKVQWIRTEMRSIGEDVRRAEQTSDLETWERLMRRMQELNQWLAELDGAAAP